MSGRGGVGRLCRKGEAGYDFPCFDLCFLFPHAHCLWSAGLTLYTRPRVYKGLHKFNDSTVSRCSL